jgi:Serine dehydrogenase proteinase
MAKKVAKKRSKKRATKPRNNSPQQDVQESADGKNGAQQQQKVSPFTQLIASLGNKASKELKGRRSEIVREFLYERLENKKGLLDKYNILLMHDNTQLYRGDADNIYNAITSFSESKPILLVLYSPGGDIAAAYLISKLCREHAQGRFIVVVPRKAKSAATLLCCGANELHMGSLSELGPIDPQIESLPALGLKHAVEQIAGLVKKYPSSATMFADYLHRSVAPINIGYYDRVVQSAAQYAERLLSQHPEDLGDTPEAIAKKLVYSYKDHGFVIDKSEAASIFGNRMIKAGTEEYLLGNDIYDQLATVEWVASHFNHTFYWVGSLQSDCTFTKRKV